MTEGAWSRVCEWVGAPRKGAAAPEQGSGYEPELKEDNDGTNDVLGSRVGPGVYEKEAKRTGRWGGEEGLGAGVA